ncbi:MAG TPA: SdrD B-like domain-containing protein, partial [Acidimicrobiales bacterium]
PVGPATTDDGGGYEFSNLPPGQYVVTIDSTNVPTGLVETRTGEGTRATDSSTGSATSVVLTDGDSDTTLDFGFWLPAPAITIVKKDAAGNDADTDATAVVLADGATDLVFTIKNTGTEALKDIKVTDAVDHGGSVTGLSCDFSPLGGPDHGTTWTGPLVVDAVFTCTAHLSGIEPDSTHVDTATVVGTGVVTGTVVTSHNPYHATRPPTKVGDKQDTPTPPGDKDIDRQPPADIPKIENLARTGIDLMTYVGSALVMLGAGLVILRVRKPLRRLA